MVVVVACLDGARLLAVEAAAAASSRGGGAAREGLEGRRLGRRGAGRSDVLSAAKVSGRIPERKAEMGSVGVEPVRGGDSRTEGGS